MTATVKGESKICLIPIYRITASCAAPNRVYSRQELYPLSESIERNGILQPLIVRDISSYEFELISGERRLRAAVLAGLTKVPCIIIHCSKKQSTVYGLIDNIQRTSPDCFSKAEAIRILTETYGFDREQTAKQLGVSYRSIEGFLQILRFTPKEQKKLIEEDLSFEHLTSIIRINDEALRRRIIDQVCRDELSAKETEELVFGILNKKKQIPIRRLIIKDLRLFCNTIEHAAATMQNSGIHTDISKNENENSIEYTIRITKP